MPQTLTAEIATRFAAIALGHLTREYPHKQFDHILTGPQDLKSPRALHPIFFGSFDWHSCIRGHWLVARLYRRFPQLPEAGATRALLDAQLTGEKVAGELRYLEQPPTRAFERPYGWAWALALQAELLRHESAEGRRWAVTLAPLAKEFVRRFEAYLPLATYPIRAGVHTNTAFALLLARDYAGAGGASSRISCLLIRCALARKPRSPHISRVPWAMWRMTTWASTGSPPSRSWRSMPCDCAASFDRCWRLPRARVRDECRWLPHP